MRALRRALFIVSFATSLVALGCSSESPPSDPGGSTTSCQRDTRADTYVAGLEKKAASFKMRILDATPAPPTKGENTWTIQVLDASGAPLDGATVTVAPYMPDHGHGSAVTPVVTPVGSDGKYTVTRVYLPMAGLWRLTVNVVNGSNTESAEFFFCLEG